MTTTTNEYICEVCEKEETLTEEQAYESGWDYPPFMGAWGVVSPRTCPNCTVNDTLWWALAVEGKQYEELSQQQQIALLRIQNEVDWDEEDTK